MKRSEFIKSLAFGVTLPLAPNTENKPLTWNYIVSCLQPNDHIFFHQIPEMFDFATKHFGCVSITTVLYGVPKSDYKLFQEAKKNHSELKSVRFMFRNVFIDSTKSIDEIVKLTNFNVINAIHKYEDGSISLIGTNVPMIDDYYFETGIVEQLTPQTERFFNFYNKIRSK